MEGNQMKMREALMVARKVIEAMGGYWARETLPIIDAALSAPPRQCDVGTPGEQFDRFAKHCIGKDCDSCEHGNRGRSHAHCALVWAQTPYAAEEGTGK